MTMRKLLESLDSISEDPLKGRHHTPPSVTGQTRVSKAKLSVYQDIVRKNPGMKELDWNTFSITYDYMQDEIDGLKNEIGEINAGSDWS